MILSLYARMASRSGATFSPVFMLVKKTGIVGLYRWISDSIRARLAPTNGARSTLLMTPMVQSLNIIGCLFTTSSPSVEADDDNPFFRAKPEIGRADHVAHILDKEDVNCIEREVLDRVLHEMRIEVTFLAGVCVVGRDALRNNSLEIVVAVYVAGDCTGPEPLCLQQRDKAFDKGGFSRADSAKQVKGPDPMGLEVPCVLIGNSVVDVVYILLQPDVDVVHTIIFERTVFIS